MNTDLIKSRARTLFNFLKSRNHNVPYQTTLDAVSVLECGRDWNALSTKVNTTTLKPAPVDQHGGNTGSGCNCKLCQRNRVFDAKIAALPEEHRGYFESLYEGLMDTEMDNDYQNAILDGSWHSAVEILEDALQRAKKKRAEREAATD